MSRAVVFREVVPFTRGWNTLAAGLLAVIGAALAAVLHMEHEGHWVTGMTNQVVWGLPHVFAIFLIVAASGALNVASMASVFGREAYQPFARLSAVLAVALLAGGLMVLVLDLGRPDRLAVAMTHFNFRSVFAWNVVLYSGFFAVVGVYLWSMMDWRAKRFYKPAALAAFLWRLVLTTATGSIFGVLVAREAYGLAVMAPLFIAQSFALGLAAFTMALIATRRPLEDGLPRRLIRLLGLFVAANLYFTAVQHGTALTTAGRAGVEAFILAGGGAVTLLFWGGQVGLGGVVPLLLAFGKGEIGGCRLRAASMTTLLGGLAQIFVILIGGQSWQPVLFPGMEVTSSFGDGVAAAYAPSLPELLLGLGGVATAALIVLLAVTALPLLPPVAKPAGCASCAGR